MGVFVQYLELTNFRNHEQFSLPINKIGETHKKFIFLYGANGSGKTSVLDALTVLFGLKPYGLSLNKPQLIHSGKDFFKIQAKIQIDETLYDYDVEYGLTIKNKSSTSNEFNESFISRDSTNRSMLSQELVQDEQKIQEKWRINTMPTQRQDMQISYLYMDPSLDFLLLQSPSGVRKFFDYMITRHDPYYGTSLKHYEKLLKERFLILNMYKSDQWVHSNEKELITWGLRLFKIRQSFVEHLNKTLKKLPHEFPQILWTSKGWLDHMNGDRIKGDDNNIVHAYAQKLQECRNYDKDHGGASIGPHKTEFVLKHLDQEHPKTVHRSIHSFSSGEQKLALLSIFAGLVLIDKEKGFEPMIFLDEWHAHLDQKRGTTILRFFIETAGQVWVTATEKFDMLPDKQEHKLWDGWDGIFIKM